MVKLAIVQGRLSSPVGGRYQYFPIHSWREEFELAAKLGFDGIEWIVSDFSNPIFDPETTDQIQAIIEQTGVQVTSISLDILMYHPLANIDWVDVVWLFEGLCFAVSKLDIRRISIPIEEHSRIKSTKDAEAVKNRLSKIQEEYGERIPLISIETDMSIKNLAHMLSFPEIDKIGVLVDTGNAAANGYSIEEYLRMCGPRIYGFHIKDRRILFQPSVPFGEGSAEIISVLKQWRNLPKLWDITLQSFRSLSHYIDDAKQALAYIQKHIV